MTDNTGDHMAPEVALLIARRRDEVAANAVLDLRGASEEDLLSVLHRLVGKLGPFGHVAAGHEARRLMTDLQSGATVPDVEQRIGRVIDLLQSQPEGPQ